MKKPPPRKPRLKTKKSAGKVIWLRKKLRIHSRDGLHARPAALFVRIAGRYKATIRVRRGRNEVDGKSIMGVLTLAAGRGSSIELIAKGPDAQEALEMLEQLLAHREMPTVVTVVRHHRSPHAAPPHD